MIETRNKLVDLLHQHVLRPVVSNDTTARRPTYPYLDYSVTAVNNEAGEGNYSFDGEIDRVDLQKRMSISINSYSEEETESYQLAKEAWNFFKHHVDMHDLTVINQGEVKSRSVLVVDEFERRYGFDVFIRFEDSIEKQVGRIDPEKSSISGNNK